METQATEAIDRATEVRKARGLELAKRLKIKNRRPGVYTVPAGSFPGVYTVLTDSEDGHGPECTCPDFEIRNAPCKHIFAVEYSRRSETMADGSTKTEETLRVTYQQNWPAYNKAQTVEKEYAAKLLRGLCDGIAEPEQTNGRPRLPLADRVWACTMKVYAGMSTRRNDTDMREWAAKGLLSGSPSYNSVCEYMADPKLVPVLTRLIEMSAAPLASIESRLAVDSSGFTTATYRRWIDHKYGKQHQEVEWLKAHIAVGARTNIIAAVRVTGSNWNDCPELPNLVSRASRTFDLAEVSADKAYLSNENMRAIVAAGAEPFIAFKTNSRGDGPAATETWTRMFHYFQFRRAEWLSHYNQRSNVETAFSMVKRLFGANLRSKTRAAQRNELLCKLLCHNLAVLVHEMFELGIVPTFFPAAPTGPDAKVIDLFRQSPA